MSTSFLGTAASNPALYDATGRIRVSQATTLHRASFLYDTDPLRWTESLSLGGATTFAQDRASVLLQIPGVPGAAAIRQTKEYFQYVPAKGQMIDVSFKAWPQEAGLIQRAGYFDDSNGVFIQLDGASTPQIVRREKTTGSVVNHVVPQAQWNLDPLDGTGPSGLVINFQLPQLLVIDFQWLGVGIIRVGFALDNGTAIPTVVYSHSFFGANTLEAVTLSSPKLPVRYEIRADAPISGPATLEQICSSVVSEGGVSERRTYSVDRGATGQAIVATLEPLISIRPNPATPRVTLRVKSFRIGSSTGANILWRLLLNPVVTGGSPVAWTDVPNANAQFDIARNGSIPLTGVGAGTTLVSGYGSDNVDEVIQTITEILPAAANFAGVPDEIVLAAQNVAGGTETVFAALEVVET